MATAKDISESKHAASAPSSAKEEAKVVNANETGAIRNDHSGGGLKTAAYLVVVLWGLSEARALFIPLCIAGLLAFLMAPIHRFLRGKARVPETLGILLSALVLLSPLALITFLLIQQGESFVQDFPKLIPAAQAKMNELLDKPWIAKFGLSKDVVRLDNLTDEISSSAGKGLTLVLGGLAAVVDASSQGVLIFVFSVLMLASREQLRRSFERILALNESIRAAQLLDDVVSLVEHFLIARLLVVLIVGALSAAGLAVFKVDYSIFIGSFFGLMTLIPAVGFILALVPTIIFAFVLGHSLGSVAGMTGALVAVNLLENNYLSPKLVGGRLNINALASFVGLFAGGLLWGVWGMFLSVPLLGIIRIALSGSPRLRPWGDLLAEHEQSLSNKSSKEQVKSE